VNLAFSGFWGLIFVCNQGLLGARLLRSHAMRGNRRKRTFADTEFEQPSPATERRDGPPLNPRGRL
jgi:hypothetical protein